MFEPVIFFASEQYIIQPESIDRTLDFTRSENPCLQGDFHDAVNRYMQTVSLRASCKLAGFLQNKNPYELIIQ